MEFNYKCFDLVCECLQLKIDFKKNHEYLKEQPEGSKRHARSDQRQKGS
jgi:hypothetical protein